MLQYPLPQQRNGDFMRFALAAAALACFAAAGYPAAPTDEASYDVERAQLEREYDNSIQSAPERPDYDKISVELKTALSLTDEQARNIYVVLNRHGRELDSMCAEYGEASLRLKKERDAMAGLRRKIKETIEKIPEVIASRLEIDQREDYRVYMLEQKGVSLPADIYTRSAKSKDASSKARDKKASKGDKAKGKRRNKKQAKASAPAEGGENAQAAPPAGDAAAPKKHGKKKKSQTGPAQSDEAAAPPKSAKKKSKSAAESEAAPAEEAAPAQPEEAPAPPKAAKKKSKSANDNSSAQDQGQEAAPSAKAPPQPPPEEEKPKKGSKSLPSFDSILKKVKR